VLRRRRFFAGRPIGEAEVKDIVWLNPSGREMRPEQWAAAHARALGVRLEGTALEEVDASGRPVTDDSLTILFNAHHEAVPFSLPRFGAPSRWRCVIDTADAGREGHVYRGGYRYPLEGRSLVLLQAEAPPPRRGGRPTTAG
jgi:glycogen operon protein